MSAQLGPKKPRILVAGYSSWAMAAKNPAAAVVDNLKSRDYVEFELVALEVPVSTSKLSQFVLEALDKYKPDAWIGIGVAVSSHVVRSEMVGLNWRHFHVPDIDGINAQLENIVEDGPVAYNSDLPHTQIVSQIKKAGIPAELSFYAGTHLCNQMTYTLRHLISERALPILSGFIHIPQSPENVANGSKEGRNSSSMSLEMSTKALEITIGCVAQSVRERSTKQCGG
ncbi:hypothetical protein [Polycladidibacter hongkongensis]|uniref:pyroglutamyl-peptidase I family protein n=1 Tax=Polycladidibacter hongkongensis TaxID=1647556 RepID=UPI00082F5A2A|nr:hypothetical protein [Pseudovibrio hongkongensis]